MSDSTDSIARLRITLADIKPDVWRTVEVPIGIALHDLHLVIQAAMGWSNSHLYEFRAGRTSYGEPDPDNDFGAGPIRDAAKVALASVLAAKPKKIEYIYDFGDNWEHRIRILTVRPAEPGVAYPRFIGGGRACPPEDCGGPFGYAGFLEAIGDPQSPDHREMLDWCGGSFDPEHFDHAAAGKVFAGIARSFARGRARSAK